jgi:hypothetical protein
MKIISQLIISLIAVSAISSNAALYDRGNGMIYDSTQNITWMQDRNYAQSSGYDADGRMTWVEASAWVESLAYGGFSDWRLPSAKLNGSTGCQAFGYFAYQLCPGYINGTNDLSFNNTRSEVGHLYTELGNLSNYSPTGTYYDYNQWSGWNNLSFVDPLTNQSASFVNLFGSGAGFWESESYQGDASSAWVFSGVRGFHGYEAKNSLNVFTWAVRDGDVLAANEVPVPAAAWLMGTGLIGLVGVARRKK